MTTATLPTADNTTTEDQRKADALTSEQLPVFLKRLGIKYERAKLNNPRDYDRMNRAERVLNFLYEKHDDVDCAVLFISGQNSLRMSRDLSTVARW